MAALAIAAGLVAAAGPARSADPAPIKQKVTINLHFSGHAGQKSEVVVKPGHPATRFKPITRTIDPEVNVAFGPIDVESYSAGGDCSVSITIKEPGQPDKTIRRNIPLIKASGEKIDGPIAVTCFASSNALGAQRTPPAIAEKPADARRKK